MVPLVPCKTSSPCSKNTKGWARARPNQDPIKGVVKNRLPDPALTWTLTDHHQSSSKAIITKRVAPRRSSKRKNYESKKITNERDQRGVLSCVTPGQKGTQKAHARRTQMRQTVPLVWCSIFRVSVRPVLDKVQPSSPFLPKMEKRGVLVLKGL